MIKILKILILLLVVGVILNKFQPEFRKLQENITLFVIQIKDQIKDQLNGQIFTKAPCTEPIPYTLGTFDSQFNISQDYFLSAFLDAEAIWEKPFGKELFVYAPSDSSPDVLKINLVYDYRQQATSKLESLGIVVKDNRISYEMLKTKFTELKIKFVSAKNDYEMRAQNFNEKSKNYEQQVEFWNKKDGAPKEEYNKLEALRLSLQNEANELQNMQTKLNEMINEINSFVVVLNRLVESLNLSIKKYNGVNDSRGESFEEGVYISDGTTREIDIYEFSSREKLVRVIAHELGHALDIPHLNDVKAIMYELNQGNNMVPTEADLEALKIKCGTDSP